MAITKEVASSMQKPLREGKGGFRVRKEGRA
jgi:hypothetical protein